MMQLKQTHHHFTGVLKSFYALLCLTAVALTLTLITGCTPSQPHTVKTVKPLMVKQYVYKSQYYYGEKNQ